MGGVVVLAALGGVLLALAFPRGPVTSGQALVTLAAALVTGLLSGLILPSRWTWLLVPLVHAAAFELGRLSASGPTVDLPRLDSAYGLLALGLGRGVYALLFLLPMVLAVAVGSGIARHRGGRVPRWPPALLTLGSAALAAGIAWPARTPPVLGADGRPLPGSVAELTTVRLGGQDQTVMIRGASPKNPVLLYLSGGPGQSDLPFVRVLLDDLTRDFVVVGWDQRGTGKSYAALDPASTLTLDRAVADVGELAEYLRGRFGQPKIYLLGESWGSTLGVLAAQRRPELYHALIGSGQMVSQRETDRRLYRDVLALAVRTGDEKLAATMRAYGEPPYADTPYANAFVMGQYERLYRPYTPPTAYLERGTRANLGPWGILGSEYTLIEKVNVLRGLMDMFTVMYPQLQELDFRRDVPRLDVPVYLLDGAAELTARRDLALEWFSALQAPLKRRFTFGNAGHSVALEQFQALHRLLRETIVPETSGRPE
ncbi:alpha/beta fold hydrolase [Deinococcus sp. NW-56]|uniref:alpha/beta fold hydrolase n=1 Tax=Deinococcus sp. NW-56 TaxID=2080419 RepID=UPI001F423FF5|nr:alpha/beta hydrolase [Deinococcus sp. NW-56]